MTELINRLLLPYGMKSVLCAVSGGADSVCLLHLLCRAGKERGFRVCAAHYNHGIRGEEAARDEAFTAELCKKLGAEYMSEAGDVPAYARENRLGTEEAARTLRYEFLHRAAKALDCEYIATAHNADDNAETMIFNLARGSGAKGLCGIPAQRGKLIRPIIGVTRREIEVYLEENSLPHVEDSTNALDDYSRNLIRHSVMPQLRRINPGLAEACLRTAELLQQDEEHFSRAVQEFLEIHFDGESVDASALRALDAAVSSRVVRALWGKSLSMVHVRAVLALAESTELSFADVPGGRIKSERGRIYFHDNGSEERDFTPIEERRIDIGREVTVPEAGVKIRAYYEDEGREINGLFKTYRLKCESIYRYIYCTGRKPGDKLAPVGRGCTKTLKSLFAEKGMTRAERERCVILRDERGILLVDGLGIDERVKAEPGERILCVEIEKI